MKISITIMAHPKRRKQANSLLAKVADQPFTKCRIIWDEQNNEWHTGERALRSGVYGGGDWHIVIQDDAIIPDGFYSHVEQAISHVPTRTLISLYTGTVRPFGKRVACAVGKASDVRASWLKHYLLFWGVGVVLPTAHIEPMLDFVADRMEAYDIRMGIFYQRNMLPVFYTNPSLVDHDDDLGSLLNHGQTPEPRVAHNFINGSVSWNSNFIDI